MFTEEKYSDMPCICLLNNPQYNKILYTTGTIINISAEIIKQRFFARCLLGNK